MSDIDICTLGAATVNQQTNVVTCDVSRDFGAPGEESEPLGEAALIQCLGVTSLPLGPSDEGHADGIVMTPCGSYASGIIGGTDTRCADVYGQLGPGETCVHSTGADASKRAKLFCKENNISLVVGDDLALVMDREAKAVTVTAFGHAFEISEANGILMGETGGAFIQLKDGKAVMNSDGTTLPGAVVAGDETAVPAVLSVGMLEYQTALEALLLVLATALDAKLATTGTVNADLVKAFSVAAAPMKAAATSKFFKAT